MSNRVKNKVGLITGAAQGLGKEMARLLIEEGAQIVMTDINEELLKKSAEELNAPYYVLDVTKPEDWQSVLGNIETEFSQLNILINNAGIGGGGDVESCDLETWDQVHKVDLDSVFYGCKFSLPLMRKSGNGSIINISSISGIVAGHNFSAYNSAKAGVRHLSKSVALHCARTTDLVRCNSIHPGFMATNMNDPKKIEERGRDFEAIIETIPLKSMGTAEDIANCALYLASDESSYVTGSEYVVDGGWTTR